MMGSDSIKDPSALLRMTLSELDVSLSSLHQSWYKFKKGKKRTLEFDKFEYNLEASLTSLQKELASQTYKHGSYRKFTVTDNKKREISVSSIKDRVVHRLIYEYLVKIFDKTFIYDAWSCRKNKGLIAAIERSQQFATNYPKYWVWRADIKKFFDNIDRQTLLSLLERKIKDRKAIDLLSEVIGIKRPKAADTHTHTHQLPPPKGLPIGNLTSQIFANIYLNELDRFVTHHEKPPAYLRYGDDFLIFERDLAKLWQIRENVIEFTRQHLGLTINSKNDVIIKAKDGLKFLGVEIFPNSRRLKNRNIDRAMNRISPANASSYQGLAKHHHPKILKTLNWQILEKNNE